jgi:hypothetical protein
LVDPTTTRDWRYIESFFEIIIRIIMKIAARPKQGAKNRKPFFSSQIHGLHTRLNILGKQSNRRSGGAIQSCELIETEIGKRDTNREE